MSEFLLALDTATERTAVGVARLEGDAPILVASAVVDAPRAAMSRLLPTAASLLDEAEAAPSDVVAVIVGRGPGSFTGVRIGVATAKGLAHGLGVSLWGVGTLDAIAWGVAAARAAEPPFTLAVAGDAMRGEIYPALFRCAGGSAARLAADTVAKPEVVLDRWLALGEPLVLAGNGLRKYGDALQAGLGSSATLADEEFWAPTAAGLFAAWVAARDAGQLGSGDPGEALPVYTRLSDAEENERIAAGLDPRMAPESGVAGAGEAR
jgi:bifunctional N6-L-threonylcarbamoyladenine synthase / protein kinase Bud32